MDSITNDLIGKEYIHAKSKIKYKIVAIGLGKISENDKISQVVSACRVNDPRFCTVEYYDVFMTDYYPVV